MIGASIEVEVGGARIALVPGGGAWLGSTRTLLVADVHIGKAETFASLGVPVPAAATDETLARLSSLIVRCGAHRLTVLGDWLHGPRALDAAVLERLAAWRLAHAAIEITVVGGNHDARAGAMPASLGIACVDEPCAAPGCSDLWLAHHPRDLDRPGYVLAGHLHPAVRLASRAGDSVRLPCWWFGARVGILPAFGAFTGGRTIRPRRGERVFATVGDAVRELPVTSRAGAPATPRRSPG
ncbi:MAG: ligase-associated DNA damage response endonuclease PdeM [Lautropia sp.]